LQVVGFDKIPDRGGAVIVYYHGAMPIDYMFLMAKTLQEKNRIILSVVDRYMIWVPGFEMLSAGFGCFAGSRKV
jgi:1-acyl-sn-glycerol-3-phosphate acyltransferase